MDMKNNILLYVLMVVLTVSISSCFDEKREVKQEYKNAPTKIDNEYVGEIDLSKFLTKSDLLGIDLESSSNTTTPALSPFIKNDTVFMYWNEIDVDGVKEVIYAYVEKDKSSPGYTKLLANSNGLISQGEVYASDFKASNPMQYENATGEDFAEIQDVWVMLKSIGGRLCVDANDGELNLLQIDSADVARVYMDGIGKEGIRKVYKRQGKVLSVFTSYNMYDEKSQRVYSFIFLNKEHSLALFVDWTTANHSYHIVSRLSKVQDYDLIEWKSNDAIMLDDGEVFDVLDGKKLRNFLLGTDSGLIEKV